MTDSGVGALDQSVQLVQLLTPEGERVEHPDYAFDPDPATLRSLYRDLVLVRRVDTEATALQRQGELGIWASLLGQEAAQVGSGRAPARRRTMAFPTLPRARRRLVPRTSTRSTLLGLYRGVNHGGWDPNEHNFHLYTIVIGAQTLHATGYAMGVQRDGAVGTGDADRDAAVIAYFGDGATSQGDVNEAFVFASVYNAPVVFFCQNNQWAISEPNEKQTRDPAVPAGRAASASPASGSTATTCSPSYAVTRPALDRARSGKGPTSSRPSPTGWARTPPPTTRPATGSPAEVEEWKLKDPIARVKANLVARTGSADQAFFDEVEREADGLAAHVRKACLEMPDPDAADDLRPRLPGAAPAGGGGARLVRGVPRQLRRASLERVAARPPRCACPMTSASDDRQGPQRGPARGDGGRPEGPRHGRGRRQARRRLPGHRRPAEGLRRGPGDRHPARRVRHHRHRDRAGAARLPAGLRDPVRRLRLPGLRPDRLPAGEDARPLARARSGCRWSSGSRSAAASARSSTTASRPEAYFAHTAGLRVVACSNPADAYWMIQQAIASDDPVIFFEPKRRYWEKGEVDPIRRPRAAAARRAGSSRAGSDVTVVAYGPMVKTALDAARPPPRTTGVSIEVVDLRSLSPLDLGTVIGSVEKTGRLVVVHEAPVFLGLGAEVAARVTERCFYSLEAPVLRVGGFDTPYPPSRLEEDYLPDLDRVLDAVDRVAGLLRRRRCATRQAVPAARRRRGPDRGRDRHLAGQARRHREGQRDDRRDRDREVAGRAAVARTPAWSPSCSSPRARPSTWARRSSPSTPPPDARWLRAAAAGVAGRAGAGEPTEVRSRPPRVRSSRA